MKKETVSTFFVKHYFSKKLLSRRIHRLGRIWVLTNGVNYSRYKSTYWLKYRLEEAASYAEALGINVYRKRT